MNFLAHIEAKRDGRSLAGHWRPIIRAFGTGELPDYQMAALLMAVQFQGLSPVETAELTLAMRDSGEVLHFPADPRPLVDKHSTGGVGDKVSLPLVPLLAALDFRVPMISGRGLGITGGTLDKLAAIPGLRTDLLPAEIVAQVQTVGAVFAGQTAGMVPADRSLYALRDATGTVPSIPLITASILSKKLAEGLDALLLDVKFGAAAFMPTRERARALAAAMVGLAAECGLHARAILSPMDQPLGAAAGNWLEVREAVACLAGEGPPDLRDLVLTCAAHLLVQTGREASLAAARARAAAVLDSGAARAKWLALLAAQGARLAEFAALLERGDLAPVVREVRADRDGWLAACAARVVGEVVRDLGGGRLTQSTVIDLTVGVDRILPAGRRVTRGDVLCRVHATGAAAAEAAAARLADEGFKISDAPPSSPAAELLEVVEP